MKILITDEEIPTRVLMEVLGELAEKYEEYKLISGMEISRDAFFDQPDVAILPKDMPLGLIKFILFLLPPDNKTRLFRCWHTGAQEVTRQNIAFLGGDVT